MFIMTKLRKLETTGHSTTERRPYLATPYGFSGLSSYRQIVRQAFWLAITFMKLATQQNRLTKRYITCDICRAFDQSKNESTIKAS